MFGVCAMRLRAPGGWGLVVVSAAALLLLAAIGLALALILTRESLLQPSSVIADQVIYITVRFHTNIPYKLKTSRIMVLLMLPCLCYY